MKQKFDYLYVLTPMDSITIAEVGQVTLKALNDDSYAWYIIVTTELGRTKIQTFGPILEGTNLFSFYGFNYNYREIDYKESTISKTIEKFINEPKRNITQCFEINQEEAIDRLKEVINTNV